MGAARPDARARGAAPAPIRAGASVAARVARHYASLPYPRVGDLEHEEPAGRAAGAIDWLLGRRRSSALSGRRLRIWVAGCGTEQAARIGLAFGDAEVLATDVSGASLRIAQSLARQLGLAHVHFERADLLETRVAGAFDLVFCTGVLHHLEDPLAGLGVLERALAPDGAAVLMLYSRQHRAGFEHFRSGLRAFTGRESPGARAAASVLSAVLRSRCRPVMVDELREVSRDHRRDLPTFADTVLHPHEHHFDLDGLMAFVRAGGFRFGSWARPIEWDPRRYFDAPWILRRLARLTPIDRWRVLYWLGGHASPLFRLVVEKATRPRPAPWRDGEIRRLRVVGVAARTRHRVRGTRVVSTRVSRAAVRRAGALRLRWAPFYGDEMEMEVPARLATALGRAVDGATIEELTYDRARPWASGLTLGAVRELLPDRLGYLVPVQSRTGP